MHTNRNDRAKAHEVMPMGMNSEQSYEHGLLCRLYELDLLEEQITNPDALAVIKAEKKKLMSELQNVHKLLR
jgi:hypothetical protein